MVSPLGFFKKCSVLVMLVFMVCLQIGLSQAYKFYVGGRDGWVLNPSENYNHWAERNRFQVNDTLFFKYKKGSDSVLVMEKEDYYSCNPKNATLSLTEGDSLFTFHRSGPFFFISGNIDSCNKGQKLIIVVMAIRHKEPAHSRIPPVPSPVQSPLPTPVPQPPTTSARPPLQSPSEGTVTDFDVPAPAPAKSSSREGFVSGWLVFGASVVASVMFGTYVGAV